MLYKVKYNTLVFIIHIYIVIFSFDVMIAIEKYLDNIHLTTISIHLKMNKVKKKFKTINYFM